jgi:hypothetical protein
MTIKAIETKYKGYRFRSRLEARWAVHFDALNVEWRYEPEGFNLGEPLGCYLPDFYLPKFNTWCEVKPEIPDNKSVEAAKLRAVAKSQKARGMFLGQIGKVATFGWHDLGFYGPANLSRAPSIYLDYGVGNVFSDPWAMLRCPMCGEDKVHSGLARSASGTEVDGFVTVIPNCCRVCLRSWEIEFAGHDGKTRARIANVREYVRDVGLIMASGDRDLLIRACEKATSARFEHGETPE